MRTIDAAARGKLPAGTTGGYDLVDVRDVAAGILDCAEKGRAGESKTVEYGKAAEKRLRKV